MTVGKDVTTPLPASSPFSIDSLLALTFCVAHAVYTWHVYHTYSHPAELQQLAWWLPLVGTGSYACMIVFGKALMSSRRPLNPKSAMLYYNIYQSVINGFMAFWLCYSAYRAGFGIWGNAEDRSKLGYNVAFGLWMHYNNKYLELFDTLFMVLKKKDEQISFLHVYHHILLVWAWFFCVNFCIGGDAYFGAAFNSLVHFFMYAYYGMALFGIPCPWKKHLTLFQMVQFVACASQSIYLLVWGRSIIWWAVPALQLFVMINMLVLFSRFYAKKYNKKPSAAGGAKKTAVPPAVSSNGATSTSFEFDAAVPEKSASPAPTFSTALVSEGSPSPSPSPVVPAEDDAAEEDDAPAVQKRTTRGSSNKKRSNKAE